MLCVVEIFGNMAFILKKKTAMELQLMIEFADCTQKLLLTS